jgi:sec-independent protein translocase protein TatB
MFGMGFGEILLVGIIAIVFLGPDKLPSTLVKVAKFFKKIKITVDDAKTTIEEEMGIDEVKKEAENYRMSIAQTSEEITNNVNSINSPGRDVKDLFGDIVDSKKKKQSDEKDSDA